MTHLDNGTVATDFDDATKDRPSSYRIDRRSGLNRLIRSGAQTRGHGRFELPHGPAAHVVVRQGS
jgi:hypothetical protein